MSRKLKELFVLIISLVFCLSLFSCDDEGKATLALKNEILQNETHTIYVSSSTESIDLAEYIIVSDEAKWKLYDSSDMKDEIESNVSLQTGANTFYIKVKEDGTKKDYTVNVIRKRALTVDFDVNGGSACSSIVVDEGDVISPPTTSRIGYDFVKWDYDFTQPISDNVSAKAEWSAKSYTISVTDGANSVYEIAVKFGEDYTISVPNKTGYRFIKVVDSNNTEFPLSGKYLEAENITLTAQYSLENYSLTYVYNADIANKVVYYTIADVVILDVPTHPNGLEFDGWYSDPQLTNKVSSFPSGSYGNKTLYAKWNQEIIPEQEIYDVVIDADGFEFDGNTFIIKYGDSYTLPVVPARDGYDFVAWLGNGEVVPTSGVWTIKADTTLTIKWQPKAYRIEYIIDNKTTNPNTITEFTIETPTITLLDATRPNSTFNGWFNENGERVTEISIGTFENITLYASFEIEVFELKYDANGGTVSKESVLYEKNDPYTLLTPEYPGYNFKGWYNGNTLIENGVWTFEEDITVVAKWEKITYLITYELFNGVSEQELKNTYTVEDTFTLPKPTKDGYVFLGWSDGVSSNVYQDVTIQKGTIGNKNYVAVWSMFSYSYSGTNATVVSYAYSNSRDKVVIPKSVNYNGVNYTVTEIGTSVFSGMGDKLAKKEIVINGKAATRFSVEIPNTLKKIGINAFSDCDDVSIDVILESGVDLYTWADSLEVAEGNDDVVDVIKGRRPAIGWSVYQ